ncbi:class I SAM-dependent methyltransferase [Aquincola sp. S2]|uniref:Class I SAM-dependent methyltransferase n=1 Tax=Pseudaquabacterium terrae TaxID=2732868 RepID=A0ABX2EH26_9BURK|nr:class I SAM-dependent methyltransferase [Aquabacterium terrae]NRF67924.1 class I SAM-dependent methyltransferase [Aquabacterium terrae]
MSTPTQELADYTAWKQWDAARFGQCSRGDARYFAWHLARCHPAPIADVLEIGFGNGSFLGFARARGARVVGIEMQDELRQRAAAAGIESHASIAALGADRRFDLIAAFDVFEHIEQAALIPLFQTLAAMLRPGGVLLCRVPNGESPFGRIFQHGDLTHVTTLGLSKFRQIASASGLAIACHGEMPWYRTARNPKRLLRAGAQRLIERVVAFAYHWDAQALAPNLVVALRRADDAPNGR